MPLSSCPSLPVRGAWIEITKAEYKESRDVSLPVRGAWIEICLIFDPNLDTARRSPCGERGLKYHIVDAAELEALSLPVRGAWIEMANATQEAIMQQSRSPCGERGLKSCEARFNGALTSVAPRAGSVD